VNQIVQAYDQNRSRRGLLRIIAHILPENPTQKVITPPKDEVRSNRSLYSSVLDIRFATGAFDDEDIDEVISLVLTPDLRESEQLYFLESAAEALVKTADTKKGDAALVRLIKELGGLQISIPGLMRALNRAVRRRRSNLADPLVWKNLNLPSILIEPGSF
jgi:hypothetical protein